MIQRQLGFTSLLLSIIGTGLLPGGGPAPRGHETGRAAPSAVLTAMQHELARSMETLKSRPSLPTS